MAVSVELAGGESIIAWQTSDGVFFELFNGNLDPVGSPEIVTGGSIAWLSAAPSSDGGFSIIWDTSPGDTPLFQDYDAGGVPIGAPYVGADPPSAPVAFTSLADSFATSGNGNIATVTLADGSEVTATFGPDGNQYAEQIEHLDSTGAAIGATFVEDAAMTSAFDDNKITPLADGGYAVSYLLQSSWTSTLDVERFAADGTHLGTVAVASLDFTGNFSYFPEILEQSIAGLPDGGFVVSWTAENNAPPQVFSEEFNAASEPTGPATLLGASIDSSSGGYAIPEIDVFANGQYTVSWASPTGEQSTTFTEQTVPLASAPSSDTIETEAASYTLPIGPYHVIMTADTPQTVIGNDLGDTITANDAASTLVGGSGNDTLIAGHGADIMTGGGGADTFVFPYLPWNAGQITDFAVGTDKLDLSALLTAAGYSGSDPVADGWVSFVSDGHGDTQVYLDSHSASDPWPTRITTLDGVSAAGLTSANVLDESGSASVASAASPVETAAADYTVPNGVVDVVLTGTAPQTVVANNLGDTITSNDYGSTIIGGSGNDVLIAGHGADVLTGGGSQDTFVFNALPWNAGQITDFNPTADTLDLSGIFHAIGYTGSNPVADGYLNFVSDNAGNTKVYVDPHGPGTAIPILVTTLEHVAPSALHQGDWVFT